MRRRSVVISLCLSFAFGIVNFDEDEARRFASLASVTYCDKLDVVYNWTCVACKDSKITLAPGIKVIDAGAEKAARVLVGKLQDQSGCVVVFRGTDNFENRLTDLEFWEHNYHFLDLTLYPNCDGCKVHTGFYTMWQNIQAHVIRGLREIGCAPEGTSKQLHLTGHSLGGALTQLAMFTLDTAGYEIQPTYTFEAPRLGNQAFSDAFSAHFAGRIPFFRATHHMDPVVHYPPQLFGYRHVPMEVFYDEKGRYTICTGAENKTCSDQFKNVPAMWALHSGEHCASPLLPNGNFCYPVGCLNAGDVIV